MALLVVWAWFLAGPRPRQLSREDTMNLFGRQIAMAAGLLCTTLVAAAERGAPVMSLRLHDGSRLTAVIESPEIPMSTPYGELEIPVSMIGTVTCSPKSCEVKVRTANGDLLTGRVDAENLQIGNALGQLSVPWGQVTELRADSTMPAVRQVTTRPVTTAPIRFEVFLRDGSCLLSTPKKAQATLRSVLGKCPMPWSLVRGVTFNDDMETSTVRFWNGDSIVGCVDWKSCPVRSELGAVRLSSPAVSKVEVSLGGIGLAKKPWAEASGNRYFMGALKNDRPKRIGGRMRPACVQRDRSFAADRECEAHCGVRFQAGFKSAHQSLKSV